MPWRHGLGFLPQLPSLGDELLDPCRIVLALPHGIAEKTHAR
jgi:hypothetical protein